MPTEEKAINGILATYLEKTFKVYVKAEVRRSSLGSNRLDISIYQKKNSTYFTAVECKIGYDKTKEKRAIQQAQHWIEKPGCWNAIILFYPENIAELSLSELEKTFSNSKEFLMGKVNHEGITNELVPGDLSELIELSNNIDEETKNTSRITSILDDAIKKAADFVNRRKNKELAQELGIEYQEQKSKIDYRPGRIACLIIANTMLLQNRLKESGVKIPGNIQNLNQLYSEVNLQHALLKNWRDILKKDYAPVIEPAIAILLKLESSHATETILKILLDAVINCAGLILKVQTDHVGPLYHSLLQTAKYDGSFYTNLSTSVLLSELAVTTQWFEDITESKVNKVSQIKVCDPACGTGTLLMSVARSIKKRVEEQSKVSDKTLEQIHRCLVEDILHGFDINNHAIHLAASMLTMSAPSIDYNKMGLWRMEHGKTDDGKIRVGSLDVLLGEGEYRKMQKIVVDVDDEIKQQKLTGDGTKKETPDLYNKCDLVIMNPPYTRNQVRNSHLPISVKKAVDKREKLIKNLLKDGLQKDAIKSTIGGTFFLPIADQLIKKDVGTLAFVNPSTAFLSSDNEGFRKLLSVRFHVEAIITSHDNQRINFSGNTRITESIVIARRSQKKEQETVFISLTNTPGPSEIFQARRLSIAILNAINGDEYELRAHYGTISRVKNLKDRTYCKQHNGNREKRCLPWSEVGFCNQELPKSYDKLRTNSSLARIENIAVFGSGGRSAFEHFVPIETPQLNPEIRALWLNNPATNNELWKMKTKNDRWLLYKEGSQRQGDSVWDTRGCLSLPERLHLQLARTTARFTEYGVIGYAFVPIHQFLINGKKIGINNDEDRYIDLCKAYCLWFNSSYGILSFLNIRSRKLTYPYLSIRYLKTLPVPKPSECDLSFLSKTFDKLCDKDLKALPQIHNDPVRKVIDDVVFKSVPDLPNPKNLRKYISNEPSVHGK